LAYNRRITYGGDDPQERPFQVTFCSKVLEAAGITPAVVEITASRKFFGRVPLSYTLPKVENFQATDMTPEIFQNNKLKYNFG
jgi:hypothetical protein